MVMAEMLPAMMELDGRLVFALKLVTTMSGLLLLWRLWCFTIRPTFAPTEPKELPYWIPSELSVLARALYIPADQLRQS